MRPDLTRTTTVRPAEEPRLPRATYRAPISRGPEHLTTHTTHITHHFRRPGAPYHAYHAYHAPFPSAVVQLRRRGNNRVRILISTNPGYVARQSQDALLHRGIKRLRKNWLVWRGRA